MVMEALSVKNLVYNFRTKRQLTNSISKGSVRLRRSQRSVQRKIGCPCITVPLSKRSSDQDSCRNKCSWYVTGCLVHPKSANGFAGEECRPSSMDSYCEIDFQDFVKPARLLAAAETNILTKYISDEMFSSLELDKSSSFYILELRTSRDFGSCLSDLNAAILLSVIDTNGDSILQRISAVSWEHSVEGKDLTFSESIHFQRGSADIVVFKGPKLGKIESLWIGLESGSWRLDGIGLTIINGPLSLSSSTEGIEDHFDLLQYNFEANNILFGDKGESVAELRPVLVREFPMENFSSFLKNMDPSLSTSSLDFEEKSNAEGMREYSDLKFSLLLYDSILVFMGSTFLSIFSSSERDAVSFLVGGVGGLVYLLLLQRSVDGLSIGVEGKNLVQGLGKLKGPALTFAAILTAAVVAAKCGTGNSTVALTPEEVFIGVAGFLTCKIAVVLAAFKPIQMSSK